MRKLFGTDGVRGKANIYPITPEMVLKLGKAAAKVLLNNKEKNNGKRPLILIGKDTRVSGYMIEYALTAGITSMGADVLLVGPMPTPAIAHLTKSFAADFGIMISASHNPYHDNGIKFFDNNGFKLNDEIEEQIEYLALEEKFDNSHIIGELIGRAKRIDDAKGRYIEFAKASINNTSLKGIKIVLDCANGASYDVTPHIFRELGAEVIVLNNNPDGLNINHDCGSLHPEQLKKNVKEEKADIGIALDGDADRVIFADEKGNEVDGDQIMCICALDMFSQNKLRNKTLVATVMSNIGLVIAMKKIGIKVIRTDVGDRYVIDEMRKHNYNFGGEQSGHLIFSDFTSTGDGTIAALQVLSIMKKSNKKISELVNIMEKSPQYLLNVEVREKKSFDDFSNVKKKVKEIEKSLKNKGRLLLRYSGTQNIARIMIEGPKLEQIKKYAHDLEKEIKKSLK
jgi:phosphoglucosamine mutase